MFGVYNPKTMEGFNAVLMGKKVDGYNSGFSYTELCTDDFCSKTPSPSACRDPDRMAYFENSKQHVPPSPLVNAPLRGTRLPIFKKGSMRYNALWKVPKSVASEMTLSVVEAIDYTTSELDNDKFDPGDSCDPKMRDETLLQFKPLNLRQYSNKNFPTKTRGALYKWKQNLLSEAPNKDCTPEPFLNVSAMKLQSTPPRCYIDNTSKPSRSGFEVSKTPTASTRAYLPLNKPKRMCYFQGLTSSGAKFSFSSHTPTRARKKDTPPTLSVFSVYHIEMNPASDVNFRRHVKELFWVSQPLAKDESALNMVTGDNPDVICDGGHFTLITAKKRSKRRCKFKNLFSGERQGGREAVGNHVIKTGKVKRPAQLARKNWNRNKSLEITPSSKLEHPQQVIRDLNLENRGRNENSKFSPNCKTVNTVLNNNFTSDTNGTLNTKPTLRAYAAHETSSTLNSNPTLTIDATSKPSSTSNTNSTINISSAPDINSAGNSNSRPVKDVSEMSGVRVMKLSQLRADEKFQCSQNGTDQVKKIPTFKVGLVNGRVEGAGQVVQELGRKCTPNTKKRYQIGRLRAGSKSVDPAGSCGHMETKTNISSPSGSIEAIGASQAPKSNAAANNCVTVVCEYDSDQNGDDVFDSNTILNMAKVQCIRDSKRNGREEKIRKLIDLPGKVRRDKPRSSLQDGHLVSFRKAERLSQLKGLNSANESNPRTFPKVKLDGLSSENRNTNHEDNLLRKQGQGQRAGQLTGTDEIGSNTVNVNDEDASQSGRTKLDDADMKGTVSQCNDPFNVECNGRLFESDVEEETIQTKRSGIDEKRDDETDRTVMAGDGTSGTNHPVASERIGQGSKTKAESGRIIQQQVSGLTRAEIDGSELAAYLEIVRVHAGAGEETGDSIKQLAAPITEARSDNESPRPPTHREFKASILPESTDLKSMRDDLVQHRKSRRQMRDAEEATMNFSTNVDSSNLKGLSSDDFEVMYDQGLGPRENLQRDTEDRAQEILGKGHLEKKVTGNKRGAPHRRSGGRPVTDVVKIPAAYPDDDEHGSVQTEMNKQQTNKGDKIQPRSEDLSVTYTLTAGPEDSYSFHAPEDDQLNNVDINPEIQPATSGADATASPRMLLRKTVLPAMPARLPERRMLSRRLNPHHAATEQRASGDGHSRPGKGIVLESPFSDEHHPTTTVSSGKCKAVVEPTFKSEGGKAADLPRAVPVGEKSIKLPQLLGNGDTLESTRCGLQLRSPVSAQTADKSKTPQIFFKYSTNFVYYGKAKVDTWLKAVCH